MVWMRVGSWMMILGAAMVMVWGLLFATRCEQGWTEVMGRVNEVKWCCVSEAKWCEVAGRSCAAGTCVVLAALDVLCTDWCLGLVSFWSLLCRCLHTGAEWGLFGCLSCFSLQVSFRVSFHCCKRLTGCVQLCCSFLSSTRPLLLNVVAVVVIPTLFPCFSSNHTAQGVPTSAGR